MKETDARYRFTAIMHLQLCAKAGMGKLRRACCLLSGFFFFGRGGMIAKAYLILNIYLCKITIQ